jgi:flagellar biosynthetic protein FliO
VKHLRNLMIVVLLSLPLYGQSIPAVSPGQTEQQSVKTAPPAPTPSAATTPAPPPATPAMEAKSEEMQFPMVRAIGGMGLVLFLLLGAFFCIKKFAPRYFNKQSGERNLRVIETLSMGDRRSISVIEVAGSRLLVGNTPQQINLLAALPDALSLVSEPDAIVTKTKRDAVREPRAPFRNLFETEKNRTMQYSASPLPEELRTKMRQLRDALERS